MVMKKSRVNVKMLRLYHAILQVSTLFKKKLTTFLKCVKFTIGSRKTSKFFANMLNYRIFAFSQNARYPWTLTEEKMKVFRHQITNPVASFSRIFANCTETSPSLFGALCIFTKSRRSSRKPSRKTYKKTQATVHSLRTSVDNSYVFKYGFSRSRKS